jgi:hypothetical protein
MLVFHYRNRVCCRVPKALTNAMLHLSTSLPAEWHTRQLVALNKLLGMGARRRHCRPGAEVFRVTPGHPGSEARWRHIQLGARPVTFKFGRISLSRPLHQLVVHTHEYLDSYFG